MQAVWSTYCNKEKQVLAQSSSPSSSEYSATIYQAGEPFHTRQFSSLNNGEKQAAINGIISWVKDQNFERLRGLAEKVFTVYQPGSRQRLSCQRAFKVIFDYWNIIKANPTYMLFSLGHAMEILLSCVCQQHQLEQFTHKYCLSF